MPFAIGVPLHHDAAASLDILTREPPRLIAEHKCHNIRDVLPRSYSITQHRHLLHPYFHWLRGELEFID